MNAKHCKIIQQFKSQKLKNYTLVAFLDEINSPSKENALQYIISYGRVCSLIQNLRKSHSRSAFLIFCLSDRFSFRHEYLSNIANLTTDDNFLRFTKYNKFMDMQDLPKTKITIEPDIMVPSFYSIGKLSLRLLFFDHNKILPTTLSVTLNLNDMIVELNANVEYNKNVSMRIEFMSACLDQPLNVTFQNNLYDMGAYSCGAIFVKDIEKFFNVIKVDSRHSKGFSCVNIKIKQKLCIRDHYDYDSNKNSIVQSNNADGKIKTFTNLEYVPFENPSVYIIPSDTQIFTPNFFVTA